MKAPGVADGESLPVQPDEGRSGAPLSHRQRMIWAGQLLDPDAPLYNMAHAITLRGRLDVLAFSRAFAALVRSTDALRTVIDRGQTGPIQRLLDDPPVDVPIVHLAPDQVETWLADRSVQPFDLAARLFDSALLRLADDHHVWFLNQHHLVCDAWSVSLVVKRQGELYQQALEGSLDESTLDFPQYRSFLEAESAEAASAKRDAALAHWRSRLATDDTSEPLRFHRRRPDHLGTETARVTRFIEGERGRRLAEFLTRPELASLSPELTAMRFFQTVLAAYLHRISGRDRVVIGSPFHNRSSRRAKRTAGLYMNLFPVVADIAFEDSMDDLARSLGAEILASMSHAAHPLPATEEAGSFEVVLNYLHLPHDSFGDQQVENRWIHSGAADSGHSLGLQVERLADDRFRLHFDLKVSLFDNAAQQALTEQFMRVIDGWLEQPSAPVASLPMLSADETRRLIVGFNADGSGRVDDELDVVAAFEAAVAADPDRVAIAMGRSGDEPEQQPPPLTYAMLNAEANALAAELTAGGVGPGHFVAVMLPRSAEAVLAILGILKAGAAYVPIEPSTPPRRLEAVLADAEVSIVCTDEAGAALIPTAGQANVILVEAKAGSDDFPNLGLIPESAPDDPAYAIFTSGSTGRPKGVQVHRRGLGNYVAWAARQYTEGRPMAFALFTSLAFDLTITSIFVPLVTGGSIVVYPDEADGTPNVISVWNDDRVDVAKATPSHLAIVRQLGLSAERLRVLVIGGEDLSTDLADAIQNTHLDAVLYNEYGPTETVVGCMIHRFDSANDRWPSVPIGTPAAGARILILDRAGQPVPPGVVGEIHIGGPGVATGYLAQPEVTAQRFVEPSPAVVAALGDDGRLYRTGDLARWRLDSDADAGDGIGRLEFLGRADDQVKIRGHRIELGEIEAALTAVDTVDGAAAVSVERYTPKPPVAESPMADDETTSAPSTRLVAHYQADAPLADELLQARLAESLPDYMVPTLFVHHRSLPLTVNGKIDRAALAEVGVSGGTGDDGDVAELDLASLPDATREAVETLTKIWTEIFDLAVKPADNFFDLGGDSIIAIQIVDRAASAGLTVTPRLLFEAGTVIETARSAVWAVDRSLPTGRGERDEFPLTPTQSGMLFHSLANPSSGVYQGQIVHRLRGDVDPPKLEAAWRGVAERHPALRTVVAWDDLDAAVQRVTDKVPAMVVRNWSEESEVGAEDRLDRFLDADRAVAFDLADHPAVRLALVAMPGHAALVWSFHHIAFDGWSIALAMNELLESYQASVDGRAWTAPSRAPFATYLDWLQGCDQAAAESFWRAELNGFDVKTPLPGDRRLPSTAKSSELWPYAARQRSIGVEPTSAVQQAAGSARVTLSTMLQAAWGLVLSRHAGTDDVVFGVTTSGRPAELPGAESMVGMTVTTLPARLTVDGQASPVEWLRAIQSRQLAVREHEYASLVDIGRWSGLRAGDGLFDSILVVENFPDYRPPEDSSAVAVEGRTYRVQSNYPLALIALPGPDLTLKAVYDPNRFDGDDIEILIDQVQAALASLTAATGTVADSAVSDPAVADLEIVDVEAADHLQRLATGPELQTEPVLVLDRILAMIAGSPGETAAACGDQAITYRQLGERSAELAQRLEHAGAGPGSVVGIRAERSVEMLVAIVGVMRSGAAYLPLDPAYPAERLAFMQADAAADLVVSGPDLAVEGSVDRTGTPRSAGPEDPAYVIYTSGSTGNPNGVAVSNRNLAWSTEARLATYRTSPDAFLLLSSFSFDSSIVGIFWTLATGGTVVMPRPGEELDVRALGALIERHQVTHTLCLPSLYRTLIDYVEPAALRSLDTVIVAGEACTSDVVTAHLAALPGTDMYNEYGPTEGSVWCTTHRCTPADLDGVGGGIPIGLPAPGATVAVLDDRGRAVGFGVPGELCIAGPGVTDGYLDRPELTAERFVEVGGRRWFRTRDSASVDRSGVIRFKGRTDDQVKVRGHRVELGEVETALIADPAVADAAAAVDQDGSRLVAFVEPRTTVQASDADDLDVDRLRAEVAIRLPDAFVPALVVALEALPRLPNGKVDRARLPAVEATLESSSHGDRSRQGRVEPSTEWERRVSAIWSELLPGATFGLDDDFFDVGGHSLLAVSLVEKIRRASGVDLPLSALLETPTVAALAARIDDTGPSTDLVSEVTGQRTSIGSSTLVPLRATGSRVPIYLIPPAAGTALSFRELTAAASPDQPLYCFEPVGSNGEAEPHDTVEAMAEHYLAELRRAQPDGRYRIGGSCLGAIVAWEMAARLHDEGTPAELLIFLDPGPPHSGPGWSYRLPAQRSPAEFVRSAFDIVRSGDLINAVQAVWRRNRFERIGRIHYRAQLSYVADRSPAPPMIWLESEELAETRPDFLDKWRILAGDDLTPILVPETTHDGLMTGNRLEVRRMTELFNRALEEFDGQGDSADHEEPSR